MSFDPRTEVTIEESLLNAVAIADRGGLKIKSISIPAEDFVSLLHALGSKVRYEDRDIVLHFINHAFRVSMEAVAR